ncbi:MULTISPECIES: nuclease-related domain-containing protein [Nocardioides]|uniref:Nuclease-related domain-containing protein n=1 Tax=Nocardioides vastitatis TaxID=2568655 RepID=A0ABW0ZKP0_9ACTN|nr:nuclease-related domain-containing protein [Nocardioides sp.]THJ07782.1 NERD domain-containing protein [Nocardioides sp.]
MKDHWKLFGGAMLALLALTSIVAALMPTGFMKGLVVGGFLVAGPAALWSWIVQVTGTAPTMMGDVAEQWTAGELRKLRSRGWHLVNHFVLAKDDMDHVVVGPSHAMVLETKWSATPWDTPYGQEKLRQAIAQAKANARTFGLWHPIKSRRMSVEPIVVLWGGGTSTWPAERQLQNLGEATVVTGRGLPTWVNSIDAGPADHQQADEIWRALEAQIARRDPLDDLEHPLPPSLAEVATRIFVGCLFALAGLLGSGEILRVTNSAWITVGAASLSLVPAMILTRAPRARHAAYGWMAGAGLPALALAVAEVVYQLG